MNWFAKIHKVFLLILTVSILLPALSFAGKTAHTKWYDKSHWIGRSHGVPQNFNLQSVDGKDVGTFSFTYYDDGNNYIDLFVTDEDASLRETYRCVSTTDLSTTTDATTLDKDTRKGKKSDINLFDIFDIR